MKKNQFLLFGGTILALTLSLVGCKPSGIKLPETRVAEFVPTDFSKSEAWYQNEKEIDTNKVDVFYVLSTWQTDWTDPDGYLHHYAKCDRCHLPGPHEAGVQLG